MTAERRRATVCAVATAATLAALLLLGSGGLVRFDPALICYACAVLLSAFGVAYRFSMWLQRPPTAMYWRRGWGLFFRPADLPRNLWLVLRRFTADFVFNRFIFRRGRARGAAHWLIMWGCIVALAVTVPLVFGWVEFRTEPGDLGRYRVYTFGLPQAAFPIDSVVGFVTFHMLVWPSLLITAGVLLAMRRRLRDEGAAALQQFGEDFVPLLLLFAVSASGLMLTASYTWMKGYAYEFLSILHAVSVIFTLLWLPFGKLFHVFQRPAHLAVALYKDAGRRGEQAACRRCGEAFASVMHVQDLITVEQQLGYHYEAKRGDVDHYQWICPRCRRALFGLAQARLWAAEISCISPGGAGENSPGREPLEAEVRPLVASQALEGRQDYRNGDAPAAPPGLNAMGARHTAASRGSRPWLFSPAPPGLKPEGG